MHQQMTLIDMGGDPPKKATDKVWKPNMAKVLQRDLPPAYREVSKLIGVARAVGLVKIKQGCVVVIPAKVKDKHYLVELLGRPHAHLLFYHYGGDRITVPTKGTITIGQRDRAIRTEYDQGASASALARRFQLSVRRIQDILTTTTD